MRSSIVCKRCACRERCSPQGKALCSAWLESVVVAHVVVRVGSNYEDKAKESQGLNRTVG